MDHKNCAPGGAPPSFGLSEYASRGARRASAGARQALSKGVAC